MTVHSVVVLGLMGAGKSTLATLLADALDRPLRDSDVDIQATSGRTASAISRDDGPDALHDLEARHLLDALAEVPPVVVAAAASTVERPGCREALRASAFVAWLDADPAVLAARFASGPHRPLLGADVPAMLRDQDTRRRPLFSEVADLRLDTAGVAPSELAARVLAALRPAGRTGGA